MHVLLLSCLLVLVSPAFELDSRSRLAAADVFSLPHAESLLCDDDSHLFLEIESDSLIVGFSFSGHFDPAVVDLTGVSTAGTRLLDLRPDGPDFFAGQIADGKISWGCVISGLLGGDPLEGALPPGRYTVARIEYDVTLPSGATTPLTLEDRPGQEPVRGRNVITDENGMSVSPRLESGSITAVDSTLLSRIDGPTSFVTTAMDVTLSATGSASCLGPLTFAWRQTGGPAVELDPDEESLPSISFVVPPVADDTAIEFELSLGDGTNLAVERVLIDVVDPSSRRGSARELTFDPERPGNSEGVLAFAAQLAWESPHESGLWTALELAVEGDNDAFQRVRGARLIADDDGDGQPSAGDRRLATADSFPADGSDPLRFELLESIDFGAPRSFFVVLDLDEAVARAKPTRPSAVLRAGFAGLGGCALFVAALMLAFGLRSAGARALVFAVSVAGLVALASCSSGGSDPAPTPDPTLPAGSVPKLQLSLESAGDVELQGEATGLVAPIDDLPVRGPSVAIE